MNHILFLFISILSIFFSASVHAQEIKSMEFVNQPVKDILFILAKENGISINTDETVSGNTSFYYTKMTARQALNSFLESNSLYMEENNGTTRVSAVYCKTDPSTGLLNLKAKNCSLKSILERISETCGKTIIWDNLPDTFISMNTENLTIKKTVEIAIKKLKGFQTEENLEYIYISREPQDQAKKNIRTEKGAISRYGDLYSIHLQKDTLDNVITELFTKGEKEYSLFLDQESVLENLNFDNKTFDQLLQLILEQGNAGFIERNGITYILSTPKKNSSSRLRSIETYELKRISVQEALSLIPQDMANSVVHGDKNSGRILLTGTREEIEPVKNFLAIIDAEKDAENYRKLDLKYIKAKDVLQIIPQGILQFPPQVLPQSNSIIIMGSNENMAEVEKFITGIDSPAQQAPIHLKYIKTDELMKNLPPSVEKSMIADSGYPNLIFFTGSEESKVNFLRDLALIDKPKPQIKYQLLVIQYNKNNGKNIKPGATVKKTEDDSGYIFSGDMSGILGLSFDVISKFGYQFATSLNAQLANNTANVFTDTTLTGITGQEIKFQNTDTYRYMEYEYDKNTGNTTTSTTQQITSGLIVSLNGWISGDNMITMNVNATISKQNGEASSGNESKSLTSLPSTSERIVTTRIRTPSGEPVVISGLIKEDESASEKRIPFFSKIPLLGKLFTQTSTSKEKTEIVIYIVPHLIEEKDMKSGNKYETAFIRIAGMSNENKKIN